MSILIKRIFCYNKIGKIEFCYLTLKESKRAHKPMPQDNIQIRRNYVLFIKSYICNSDIFSYNIYFG